MNISCGSEQISTSAQAAPESDVCDVTMSPKMITRTKNIWELSFAIARTLITQKISGNYFELGVYPRHQNDYMQLLKKKVLEN